ncbi:MAG: ComF family protein [Eudoraea sp.]|nr:ComF family protein [Eudoraea sp.]NNL03535.1 ComF family protein [Eudoraea sp.]
MCTLCRNQIPLTEYNFIEQNAVDTIFYGRIDIKKAAAFLFYSDQGIVKNLIHFLKYKNQPKLSRFLGDWYGQILKERNALNHIDIVIPVPLHKKKFKKRGYNQVSGFAKRIAEHINASYMEHILVKTANTRTQTKKNRIYRWRGMPDLYKVTHPEILSDKNVLLVDDVITTGATIETCARAIKKAKGVSISVAAMAVVP